MPSAEGPFALTLPSDGMATTRRVAHRFVKKMAKDFFSLKAPMFGHNRQQTARDLAGVLRGGGRELVLSVFRRPQVHVFLVVGTRGLTDGDSRSGLCLEQLLAQLVFELSCDGKLGADGVYWPGPLPLTVLGSPTRGLSCSIPEGCTGALFQNTGIHFEVDGERSESLLQGSTQGVLFAPVEAWLALLH